MGEERGEAVEWVEVEPGVRVRAGARGSDHGLGSAVPGGSPGRMSGAGPDGARGSSWDRWLDATREGMAGGAGARSHGVGFGGAARPGRGRWALGAAVGVLGVIVLVRVLGQVGGLAAPATALVPGGYLDAGGAAAPAPPELGAEPARESPATGLGADAAKGVSVAPDENGAMDWWDVVGILDGRRTAVLEALDVEGLGTYAELGSAAWSADLAVIEDLSRRGLVPVGLATDLIAIEEAPDHGPTDMASAARDPADRGGGAPDDGPDDGGGVSLVIVDRRSAYALRDESGETVAEVPAAESRRWRLTLVPATSGDPEVAWRIGAVDALP